MAFQQQVIVSEVLQSDRGLRGGRRRANWVRAEDQILLQRVREMLRHFQQPVQAQTDAQVTLSEKV